MIKPTNINLSEKVDDMISSNSKKMILKTGKPFTMVDDPDMQSCLGKLDNTKQLAKKCEKKRSKTKISNEIHCKFWIKFFETYMNINCT